MMDDSTDVERPAAEESKEQLQRDDVQKPALEEDIKSDSVSAFKTPSFVIPSKKKVKAGVEDVFKAPDLSLSKNSNKTDKSSDTTCVDAPQGNKEQTQTVSESQNETAKLTDAANKSQKTLSPAEQLKHSQAAVPYKEPAWSSNCDEKYSFEVIKNGAVIDTIDLTSKCFHVVGRLPSCNIPMEHPSLSRYHAVIQYSGGNSEQFTKGWYLFDLDSTHGTWINKNKVPPKKFHRLHVDYVLKFGGSTRLFILQGPDSDREAESELSASEMKEQREKQKKEAELIRQAEIEEAERKVELLKKREESKGCSWGIDEDDAEEEDEGDAENPFASIEPENETLYINDPKKALNGYFEREGLDLPEYEFHEAGFGKWKCTIELPIDTPNGEPMVAEAVVSGKRKEAVIACALEACRILDRHGELRKAAQESRKRKQKNWEDDDFYDSDEDTYLDRTGAIEKKRELRKMKVGKNEKTTETYDSLMEKHKGLMDQIQEIEDNLEKARAQAAAMEADDVDALDAYMSAIKSGMMDTKTKMKLKRQLMELKQEEQKVRKLINVAKPASLPELKPRTIPRIENKAALVPSFGKMKGPAVGKIVRKPVQKMVTVSEKETGNDTEEEEEENEEPLQETGDAEEISKNSATCISEQKVDTVDKDKEVGGTKQLDKENRKQSDSGPRAKGPILPLAAVLEKLKDEADNSEAKVSNTDNSSETNKKKRKSADIESKSGKKTKTAVGYGEDDPDYAVWLPPENQSGDGKTHLNEKLGY